MLFDEQVQTEVTARFQIDSAHQGQEGLARVHSSLQAKQPYAMAFVDIRMPPGWDGVETTQKLWEVDPDLQVVICTAYSDYSWDAMISKLGHSDRLLILKKPFDTVEVMQLAHALTEKWWLLQMAKSHVGELELKVTERTQELSQANVTLQLEVVERKKVEDTLRTKTDQLQAITDAMMVFLQSGDWRKPSSVLLHSALSQTGSEYGFLGVVADRSLRILAQEGLESHPAVDRESYDRAMRSFLETGYFEIANLTNLFGRVITQAASVISNDPVANGSAAELLPGRPPVKCFLGVPIFKANEVVGMIGVANRPSGYSGGEQNKIEILTQATGVLYDSYRRHQREAFLEQELRQAHKVEAIGRLAGGVAHDFNNILTAILGHTDLLLCHAAGDPKLQKSLEEIKTSGQRAAALTRQLLAFSRKQILQPKVLNLDTIVSEMEDMLQRLIGEHIELITLSHAKHPCVKADSSQLGQVLMNLVVNARDAMLNGGRLMIETSNVTLDQEHASQHEGMPPGQYVLLTVSDTGTGMTPEVKQRIFDPFFTTKKQGEGTGLGLATCHGIVKQSGGYIEVTTELGHGSTFWIYLPEVEGESKIEPRREESRNMPGGNETVLLVEDEPSVRGLAVMILRRLGYKVLEAASGNEALSIVDKTTDVTIDLLLTDVVMPQMSGKQLADRLHASHPEIKVLFASGYTEDAIVEQGILLPGLNFLHKPYTPSILAQRVREVLEAPTAVAVAGQI